MKRLLMEFSKMMLFVVSSILLLLLLLIAAWYIESLVDPCRAAGKETAEYSRYVCYDENVEYLENLKIIAHMHYKDENGNDKIMSYYRIKGESTEQFVVARQPSFMEASTYTLCQNPDNYIDVILEWDIKEIQIYDTEMIKADHSSELKYTTDSSEIVDELRKYIKSAREVEESLNEYDFMIHRGDQPPFEQGKICVIFDESKNIYWEADIVSYFDENGEYKNIVISNGRAENKYTLLLDPESALYQLISPNI